MNVINNKLNIKCWGLRELGADRAVVTKKKLGVVDKHLQECLNCKRKVKECKGDCWKQKK